MRSSYVGNRHARLPRLLDISDLFFGRKSPASLNARYDVDTLISTRHSHIPRATPRSLRYAPCPVETGATPGLLNALHEAWGMKRPPDTYGAGLDESAAVMAEHRQRLEEERSKAREGRDARGRFMRRAG